MTRAEMIEELKAIDLRAVPTVITFDMGLEYDYVTSKGAGTSFGGMGGWPAHIFRPIKQEKWQRIRKAVKTMELRYEDLEGTDLSFFVQNIHSLRDFDLSEALDGLLELPEQMKDHFYCFYDTGTWYNSLEKPMFFMSAIEVKREFINAFANDIILWDDMDDDEVKTWYDRIHDDMNSFVFIRYYDDEEDDHP